MRRRSSQLKTGSKSIEKPSRLIAINFDDSTLVSSGAIKNKTLLTASDQEQSISAKTCNSYEYARDMSRIIPDIALSETSVNPFVKLTFLNRHQKLKIFFGAITLLPIRVILITLVLSVLTPYGWLAYHLIGAIGLLLRLKQSTIVKLKYWLRWPLLWLIRVILFLLGFYYIETVPKTNKVCNGAQLLVAAPHRSVWDVVPYWCASRIYGNVTVASRYENSRIPILGCLLMMCDPILVKRDDSKSRSESRRLIRERSNYQKVLIYPEGTCTNGKHLVEFKTGAFIAGQEVQPMAIEYKLYDKYIDNVTWTWLGYRAWQLVALTLCIWRTDLKLTIMPTHKPKKSERLDSRIFARRVEQKLSRQLALPISRYSFDDAKLMEMATELELPRSLACLRFLRLCYALHIEMCLKMSQDISQEALLMQEAQLLSDEIDTIDEDDFTSYSFKTLTVPDAITQIMRDFMLKLYPANELDMLSEITSRRDFVEALNINSKYSSKINKTSVIDYLIKAIRCDDVYSVNLLNVLLLMVLCDVREKNIAIRILTCMRLMSVMNKLHVATDALPLLSTSAASNIAGLFHHSQAIATGTSKQPSIEAPSSNSIQQQQTFNNQSNHNVTVQSTQTEHTTQQASNKSLTSKLVLIKEQQSAPVQQASDTKQVIGNVSNNDNSGATGLTLSPADCSSSLSGSNQSDNDDVCISFEQFQLIIWLLLGIENLDKNCFPDITNFSFDYVIDNLKNWFTHAVNENLPNSNDLNALKAKIDLASILTKPVNASNRTKNKFLQLVQDFN